MNRAAPQREADLFQVAAPGSLVARQRRGDRRAEPVQRPATAAGPLASGEQATNFVGPGGRGAEVERPLAAGVAVAERVVRPVTHAGGSAPDGDYRASAAKHLGAPVEQPADGE